MPRRHVESPRFRLPRASARGAARGPRPSRGGVLGRRQPSTRVLVCRRGGRKHGGGATAPPTTPPHPGGVTPNPCLNGGTCSTGTTPACTCAAGFTGTTCQTNVNNCTPNPCLNGGTCTDGVNTFTCACVTGFTGTTCQTNINNCAPNPCLNGGTCTDGVNTFTCTCVTGFTGTTCQTNINNCAPNPSSDWWHSCTRRGPTPSPALACLVSRAAPVRPTQMTAPPSTPV